LTEELSKNYGIDYAIYDPTLSIAKLYCGSVDLSLKNPLVSPIFGDLKDLPHFNPAELIRDEGIALSEKLREAGVDAKLEVFEDMVHVFQQFTFDSKAKLDW